MSLSVQHHDGVATLTLNRPQLHNAFDDDLIALLIDAVTAASTDDSIRALVLRGAGKSFSAGADLNWMRRMAAMSHEENLVDTRRLAHLLRLLDTCPKPTLALVQGACFAGAVGLVTCCDIAIAARDTQFAISEVRIGLIPAVISPYLVRAMGARQARRWLLTAERFNAEQALALNVVHQVVELNELDNAAQNILSLWRQGSPVAIKATKQLIADVATPIDDALIDSTARRIADMRASEDGKEGVAAFLEKRKPKWQL